MAVLPALLLLAAWLQPLHVLPWVSWHSEALAVLATVGFFLVSLHRCWRAPSTALGVSPAAIMSLFFVAIAVLQHLGGQVHYLGDALVLVTYFLLCAMAIMVGFQAARFPSCPGSSSALRWAESFAILLLVGAVTSTLVALVQAFGVWDWADWVVRKAGYRRPGANFGQPNHFATLVLMGVGSLAYLRGQGRISKSLSCGLLPLLLSGLVMSESRAGLVSLFAMTLWWFVGYRRRLFFAPLRSVVIVWMFTAGLLLTWPALITEFYSAGSIESVSNATLNTAAGTRLEIWPQLLNAVGLRPWLGWGLREVSTAHNAVLDQYQIAEPFTFAHNLVLDLLVGLGVPLSLLVLGVVGHWAWKKLNTAQTHAEWFCIAALIPIAVHSQFEYPFAYTYFLLPAMLLIGAIEGYSLTTPALRLKKGVASAFVAIFSCGLIFLGLEYLLAEEDFRVARFEALKVGSTPSTYSKPPIYALTQLDAMLLATRTNPTPNMSLEDIEALRAAAMRFPWTAIQNRYALSLALNGQPEEALRQLKVMGAMHGEESARALRSSWIELGETRYPQLKKLLAP